MKDRTITRRWHKKKTNQMKITFGRPQLQLSGEWKLQIKQTLFVNYTIDYWSLLKYYHTIPWNFSSKRFYDNWTKHKIILAMVVKKRFQLSRFKRHGIIQQQASMTKRPRKKGVLEMKKGLHLRAEEIILKKHGSL